jgi:FlaA1/EpsC-like NDP-sugar epimerase
MDLARDLVRLAGRDPESQPIETVGLRPGEKLHEELFYDAELVEPTASTKVLRAIAPPSSVDVREHVRQLLAMASGANEGALRLALLSYVGGIQEPEESREPSTAGGTSQLRSASRHNAAAV